MFCLGGLLVVICFNGEGFDILMLCEELFVIDFEYVNFFSLELIVLFVVNCGLEVLEVIILGRFDVEFVCMVVLEN